MYYYRVYSVYIFIDNLQQDMGQNNISKRV